MLLGAFCKWNPIQRIESQRILDILVLFHYVNPIQRIESIIVATAFLYSVIVRIQYKELKEYSLKPLSASTVYTESNTKN